MKCVRCPKYKRTDYLFIMFSFHIVCGTTGESVSLTVSERKLVAEEWMKVAGGRYHFND